MGFNGDLYPEAGATSVMTTKGDMVDYNTARQRLGIGSANQILQVKSSLPSWETVDLADTVLTTAGDILYENNTPELARLPKGSDADVLTLASGLPSWSAPAGGGGAWEELANVSASSADELDSGTITAKDWLNVQVYMNGATGSGNQNFQLNFNTDQWDDGNSKYATQEFTSYSFGVAGRTAQPTFYWGVGYTRADEFYAQTWITNRTGVVSLCQPMQCIIGYGDATTAPFLQQMYGLWNDTNQITKVTASINPSYGAGNWYMRVLGSD